ncbi:MAG: hypothetical protein B7Z08_05895 [Sphingomonadales bacterium 32-68-7]|nr:MAG: hypothetical protein B7Z33_11145 [Sphingomonadales bacterium 12-68-11]OYX09274.1 MAG: hypothetical protein B7Z08_05895 [Sphingomonadales bacterium 32-68-7]
MTVPIAQMRIARDISEAERALDEALIRQSSLFTTMVTARRDTRSDPYTGHEALLRLAKSQQSLLEAGGNLARVHGSLLGVQKELCGADDCPPEETEPVKRLA